MNVHGIPDFDAWDSMFGEAKKTKRPRKQRVEYDMKGSGQDAFGRPIPSLQIKILIVFRLLGNGGEFASVYDGSKVDEQTARIFFYRFNEIFARSLYRTWVHPPSTDQEVDEILAIYKRLGLPGAIGSTDCFQNAMYTCAVLHNMLLHYDGFDKLWTADDWRGRAPQVPKE
jgi:hypothetical protein